MRPMSSGPRVHPLKAWRNSQTPPVTQGTLASRAGTTKGHVSKIEAGLLEPQLELVRRLVEATGGAVTADEIVWWKRSETTPGERSAAA